MGVYVIKSWRAGLRPVDDLGHYVHIVARSGGLLGRWLARRQLRPTTRLALGIERLEFTRASLWGLEGRLVPLESISSTYYGYTRPWAWTAGLVAIFLAVAASLMVESSNRPIGLAVAVFGLLFGAAYAWLNRILVLGFVEQGGRVSELRFRPTLIDGEPVDEDQARQVCKLAQRLLEARRRRLQTPMPTSLAG